MKKLLIMVLMLFIAATINAQVSYYIIPYATRVPALKIDTLATGGIVDSIIVVNNGVLKRIKNPFPDIFTAGYLTAEVDGSITNELQTLTALGSRKIALSMGDTITLDSMMYAELKGKPISIVNVSQLTNDVPYLITELDPTVPANVKAISAANISNWNNAFGWGNHAGLYPPISRTLSINGDSKNLAANASWTVQPDTAGAIATKTYISSQISTREPTIAGSTTDKYWRGDKTWQTLPIAPSQLSLAGGANTKVTGSYPNLIVADSFTTKLYSLSGVPLANNIKMAYGIVTPTAANGYSIDISGVGFTTVVAASVVAIRNTTTASTSPNVSYKSISNTAIVVNIVEDNTVTTNVLTNLLGGVTGVITGSPSVFANVSGLTLSVIVFGY